MNMSGSSEKHVDFRLGKARGAFYAAKSILCDKRVPLALRLHELTRRVYPVFLCNMSSVVLSQKILRRVQVVDRHFLRSMLGLRRRPEDSFAEFISRATSKAIRLSCHFQHVSLDVLFVQRIFNHASKIAVASRSTFPLSGIRSLVLNCFLRIATPFGKRPCLL